MRSPDIERLADILVNFSTRAAAGEVVQIEYEGAESEDLARACAEQAVRAGAIPIVEQLSGQHTAFVARHANDDQLARLGEVMLERMKRCQCYIGIRGAGNIFEQQGVTAQQRERYARHISRPVHLEQRVKHTRWVVLRYPNPSMAQLAERNTRDFADHYFRACCLDWSRVEAAGRPLEALMNRTDRVRLVGRDTDLRFSIKDIPAVLCAGRMNIPDGECFTAPVRDSIEGTVRYNCKTTDRSSGQAFDGIWLRFERGRVVEADAGSASKTAALNEILDQDEGARYVGEFAIGFHPHITTPMNDILFDEKICGSFHMALGNCYDDAPNGNKSALHWDLVQIQRPEFGGGEIWLDDTLIRRDGLFVLPELEGLNPDLLGG